MELINISELNFSNRYAEYYTVVNEEMDEIATFSTRQEAKKFLDTVRAECEWHHEYMIYAWSIEGELE